MNVVGLEWNQMSTADKERFEEISSRDKKRYQKEMKQFQSKGGSKQLLSKIKNLAPKKCLSAYMIFVRETRKRI